MFFGVFYHTKNLLIPAHFPTSDIKYINKTKKESKMFYPNNEKCDKQQHVHEITGSTAIVEECGECHNHRFCTVSDEAIPYGVSHVHEVKFRTDFSDGHFHEFCGKTGPAIEVGNGKHVHYIKATTEEEGGHRHNFQAATLIDAPTDFEYCD